MFQKLKALKGKFRYDESEMPFLEHLDEFRKMAIRCILALVIGILICLPLAKHMVAILRAPAEPYIEKSVEESLQNSSIKLHISEVSLQQKSVKVNELGERYIEVDASVEIPASEKKTSEGSIRLQFSEPAAAVKMWLTVAFFGGLLLSMPILVFVIGLFVLPGVRDIERKLMTRISLFSGGLFVAGVLMGYKVTLPLALGLMLKVGGSLGGESIWFYNKYITFALQLLLGFGVAFQLPVVILILGKMGLVNSTQLREKRRHVIVALLILAMILTPPDIMTQLLMAGPLIFLYEFCIWFLYFSGNRGSKESVEDDVVDAESVKVQGTDDSADENF